MIIHVSIRTPKHGREPDLSASMRRYGAADPFDECEAAEVQGVFLEEV
jgi:hypothetical protein